MIMNYAFLEDEVEGMGLNEPLTQPFELTQVAYHKHECLECGSPDIIDDEGEAPACAHCGAVYTGQIDEMVILLLDTIKKKFNKNTVTILTWIEIKNGSTLLVVLVLVQLLPLLLLLH